MSKSEFFKLFTAYNDIYTYITLIAILFFSYHIYRQKDEMPTYSKRIGLLIVLCLTLYFGTFPYSLYGGDRFYYVNSFINGGVKANTEGVWYVYTQALSPVLNVTAWLILTAFLYCLGFWTYSKRIHPENVVVMMLGFLGFLFFKAYAVNTMRAGLAASCIFYALTWRERKIWVHFLILLCAVNIHFSMALPALALVLTNYFKSSKSYFYLWLLCVPLSYVAGDFFQVFFEPYLHDFSFGKTTGYLLEENSQYDRGFRWDFLFYSMIPVFMAYYYIYKKGVKDVFYESIFNSYLFTNSFWILVIRAGFSDRMAYLSWMFIPILLLYPALKYDIWDNQSKKIAYILLGQELFTFALSMR